MYVRLTIYIHIVCSTYNNIICITQLLPLKRYPKHFILSCDHVVNAVQITVFRYLLVHNPHTIALLLLFVQIIVVSVTVNYHHQVA